MTNPIRPISAKCARVLRKRGEAVRWSLEHGSYVWHMTHKYLNRWHGDTTRVPVKS